jgi:tetratricopeptide (TPR) repeat protein
MGKLQQDTGILNEGDVLREQIAACEKALAAITPESARALMENAADAHRQLESMRTPGADVRAEESRLTSIEERMIKSARPIVAAAGGPEQFAALRQQLDPDTTGAWWRLDDVVAAARRKQWQRIGIGVLIVALIGLTGYLLRGWLFPPDPVGDAVFRAQAALRDGTPAQAIEAIDLGLTGVPTSTTLLIWKAVLLDRQGDPSAPAVLEAARGTLSERDFVLEKSQVNLILGNFDQVITDTTQLIGATPNLAEAYYMRASGHEGRNDNARAIQDLEEAARIAQETGNDTLFATARVRLGMLMQNAGAAPKQP